ncbi:MAG: hypothetical protein COC15_05130 [Legionellales bacterium]|nr:MAG: hypothetical protein COC15_05130 [Legionellales bacterium]
MGIAEQICAAMVHNGLSVAAARDKFWLIDKPGLLQDNMQDLSENQLIYSKNPESLAAWQVADSTHIKLAEVISNVKPTVLIGCSGVGAAFSETAIRTMAQGVAQPIIFPLSNPTKHCEAIPSDILTWTNGMALIATGSPFNNVVYNGSDVEIAQCNNALSFPGIGLGVLAVKASTLSDNMLRAACMALSEFAPIAKDANAPLLPNLSDAREVAKYVALKVAEAAIADNVARLAENYNGAELAKHIDALMWQPEYQDL